MQAAPIPLPTGRTVFLSHVPPPEKVLRHKLIEALSPLSKSGLITLWSDDELQGGHEIASETDYHLQNAQFILLLVSPVCLNSDDWNRQAQTILDRAQSGYARVIPVLLRPTVGWRESTFGHLVPLPTNGKPVTSFHHQEDGWFAVANGVMALVAQNQVSSDELVVLEQVSAALPPVRQLLNRPPEPHQGKSIPRPQAVTEIYQHLTSAEVSALVLTGVWGLGKSELAAQVCQFAELQRQSGQGPFQAAPLWFTLEKTSSLFEICAALCQASGRAQPLFQNMAPPDLVVTLCELLQQDLQPCLVVIDQFESWLDPQTRIPHPEHHALSLWLEQLNSHLSSSRILFTSRLYPHNQRMPLDAYMQRHPLNGLNQSEGFQLLRKGHLQESDAELASAIAYYQGHPLALTWLRDLLRNNHVVSLATLLQDIAYKQRFAKDLAHSVLHYMYTQQLTDEQRELLLAFATYRQPVPLQAALRIIHASPRSQQANAALRVLLDLELVQEAGLLVYRVLPMIRDFVQASMSDLPSVDERLSQAHQVAAYYYQELFAAAARRLGSPSRDDTLLLLEAAWHLCQAGQPSAAIHLIHHEHLFQKLGRWGDNTLLLDLYQCLLPLEAWNTDPTLAGQFSYELGTIYNALGQKIEARTAYEHALSYLRQAGEPALLATALNDLGTVYRSLKQGHLATACYQEAWTLCEQAAEPFPQRGITLNNQGLLLYEQGQEREHLRLKNKASAFYREALVHYEQALATHLRNHLTEEEGWTLLNLADVYAALDQQPQALAHYHQALSHFRAQDERRGEGTTLNNLGLLLAYDPTTREQAASCYTQALRIFRVVGDRWQERKALKNLGHWLFISVPPKEPARSQTCISGLACFCAARDPFAPTRRTDLIPTWLLTALRQDLGELKAEECIQAAEARSWQIIEELLQLSRDFV